MAKLVLRVSLFFTSVFLFLVGAAWYWYTHRPVPESVQQILYEGVAYTRDVRSDPRPLVSHIIRIDLKAQLVGFLVTPGDPNHDRPLRVGSTIWQDQIDMIQ